MPVLCKNPPVTRYTGNEPSPKGLGVCARDVAEGKSMKGTDGRMWVVRRDKLDRLSWRSASSTAKKATTATAAKKKTTTAVAAKKKTTTAVAAKKKTPAPKRTQSTPTLSKSETGEGGKCLTYILHSSVFYLGTKPEKIYINNDDEAGNTVGYVPPNWLKTPLHDWARLARKDGHDKFTVVAIGTDDLTKRCFTQSSHPTVPLTGTVRDVILAINKTLPRKITKIAKEDRPFISLALFDHPSAEYVNEDGKAMIKVFVELAWGRKQRDHWMGEQDVAWSMEKWGL